MGSSGSLLLLGWKLWLEAMAGNYAIGVADNWINKGMSFGQAMGATPIMSNISYSPSSNTVFNNQVSAHNLPGIMNDGQQGIANNIAGFSGLDYNAILFPDLTMPGLELGGIALTASPQYNTSPTRINYEGDPDDIYLGLIDWADYLYVNGFNARKTKDGRYYHLSDIFYNLPTASIGGYHPMGDVKTSYLRASNGNLFSIGIPSVKTNSRNKIFRVRMHQSLYAPKKYQLSIFFEGAYNDKGVRDNIVTFRIRGDYESIGNKIFGENYYNY